MKNHSNNNTPTAQPASQQNGEHADIPQPTITAVEGQEDASGCKFPDLPAILTLNSIREVVDLIEQGAPTNFVPGLVSKLAQASAEVVAWLVREED